MKSIIGRAIQLNKEAEQLNRDLTTHITEKFNSVKSVAIHNGTFINIYTKCGSIIWFGCESDSYRFEETQTKIHQLETDELEKHFKDVTLTKEQAQEIFEYVKSFCVKG